MKSEESKQNLKLAKDVVIGDYIMLKNQPCVVTNTLHSKPGKHVMKALIQGRNLFSSRKIDDIIKLADTVELIQPQFYQFEVLDVDEDDMVSVLDQNSELKQIKLQDLDQLKKNFLEQFRLCLEKEVKFFAKIIKVNNQQKVTGFKN